MDLLNRFKAVKDAVKTKSIETKTIGVIELMPMFVSHRNLFHRKDIKEGQKDFILTMIAMSISDNGHRLIDSMDLEEVILMLDPLGQSADGMEDIYELYTAANDLSKLTVDKVEEAQKN